MDLNSLTQICGKHRNWMQAFHRVSVRCQTTSKSPRSGGSQSPSLRQHRQPPSQTAAISTVESSFLSRATLLPDRARSPAGTDPSPSVCVTPFNSHAEPCATLFNSRIAEACSVADVLEVVASSNESFTIKNALAAFVKVAKLGSPHNKTENNTKDDVNLAVLSDRLLQLSNEWSARVVANLVWAHAQYGHGSPKLLQKIFECAIKFSDSMNDLDVCTVVWSMGRLVQQDPQLRPQAVRVVAAIANNLPLTRVRGFCIGDLSRMLWALARLKDRGSTSLHQLLCTAALDKLDVCCTQSLSTIAWSCAKLHYFPEPLFDGVAEVLVRGRPSLNAHDLSNTAYALATTYTHWAQEAASRNGVDSDERGTMAQQLRSVLSAGGCRFSAVKYLATCATWELQRCNSQSVTTLAWAFASLHYWESGLYGALAQRATQLAGKLDAQAISSIAWAFACVRHRQPQLFDSLAEAGLQLLTCRNGCEQWSSQSVSMAISAYAKLDCVHSTASKKFIHALAQRAAHIVEEFTAQGVCHVSWSLVVCGYKDAALMTQLRLRGAQLCSQMASKDLVQMYQVELAMKVDAQHDPAGFVPPKYRRSFSSYLSYLFDIGHIRAAAQRRWLRLGGTTRQTVSSFQHEVYEVAAGMGLHAHMEYKSGGFSIDVALLNERVAIEADGPSHFCVNTLLPTGATLLRRRLLTHTGWRVLVVPFFHWDKLTSHTRKQLYLWHALDSVGVAPALKLRDQPTADDYALIIDLLDIQVLHNMVGKDGGDDDDEGGGRMCTADEVEATTADRGGHSQQHLQSSTSSVEHHVSQAVRCTQQGEPCRVDHQVSRSHEDAGSVAMHGHSAAQDREHDGSDAKVASVRVLCHTAQLSAGDQGGLSKASGGGRQRRGDKGSRTAGGGGSRRTGVSRHQIIVEKALRRSGG